MSVQDELAPAATEDPCPQPMPQPAWHLPCTLQYLASMAGQMASESLQCLLSSLPPSDHSGPGAGHSRNPYPWQAGKHSWGTHSGTLTGACCIVHHEQVVPFSETVTDSDNVTCTANTVLSGFPLRPWSTCPLFTTLPCLTSTKVCHLECNGILYFNT